MANFCDFTMKIHGKAENLQEFYKALSQDGDIWMGHGADAEIEFEEDGVALISGCCDWSIQSALIDNAVSMREESEKWRREPGEESRQYITLFEACKKWGLVMEVFSQEPGIQFQEHYSCYKGLVVDEECVKWRQLDKDEFKTKEDAEEWLETKISDEEWNDDEPCISRGGFEDYACFLDLSAFLGPDSLGNANNFAPVTFKEHIPGSTTVHYSDMGGMGTSEETSTDPIDVDIKIYVSKADEDWARDLLEKAWDNAVLDWCDGSPLDKAHGGNYTFDELYDMPVQEYMLRYLDAHGVSYAEFSADSKDMPAKSSLDDKIKSAEARVISSEPKKGDTPTR